MDGPNGKSTQGPNSLGLVRTIGLAQVKCTAVRSKSLSRSGLEEEVLSFIPVVIL